MNLPTWGSKSSLQAGMIAAAFVLVCFVRISGADPLAQRQTEYAPEEESRTTETPRKPAPAVRPKLKEPPSEGNVPAALMESVSNDWCATPEWVRAQLPNKGTVPGMGGDCGNSSEKSPPKPGSPSAGPGFAGALSLPKGNPDIFYWKLQPNGNPNHCGGQPRVVTRWPTDLYRYAHVTGKNSYVVAGGVKFSYYALDGGGGGAKPSYAVCGMFGKNFPPKTKVLLYRDGKPVARVIVPNPAAPWKVSGDVVELIGDWWVPPGVKAPRR